MGEYRDEGENYLSSSSIIKEVDTMYEKFKVLKGLTFNRDDFVRAFYKIFNKDQIENIEVMCGYPQYTDEFILCRNSDEFHIIHFESGVSINWYKHLGRSNWCNNCKFTYDDLLEFLKLLKEDIDWNKV